MKNSLKFWQACILMWSTHYVFLLMQGLRGILIRYFDYLVVSRSMYGFMICLACIFTVATAFFMKYRIIKCPKVFQNKSYSKIIKKICDILSIILNGIIPWYICWFALTMSYEFIF